MLKNTYIPERTSKFSSLARGLSRMLDLGGTLPKQTISSSNNADVKAFQSDWTAIGNDIRHAMEEYDNAKTKGQ
jgi:hypothetical protein